MAFDRFIIAPLATGTQLNLRPWLIMDDAFTQLQNVYCFRGRIRKRLGERLSGYGWPTAHPELAPYYSRAAIFLGNTSNMGAASGTVPGVVFNVGAAFTIGNAIYTVQTTGTPVAMLKTVATTTATFNTTTGAYVFAGAPVSTAIYFYPGEPIMGMEVYDQVNTPVNNQPTWVWDTQFAYVFTGGRWIGQMTPVWHDPDGNKDNFFWACNWESIQVVMSVVTNYALMFVTNYQVTNPNGATVLATDDPIWWYNGATWYSTKIDKQYGFYFLPNSMTAPYTGPFVQTARLIVVFKNRLVLLNTIECDNSTYMANPNTGINTQYVNRARFSHNGSPVSVTAWYEPNTADSSGNFADGAGYVDAPTDEAIVTAEFIKDRLIVFFERSTWELAYTQSEVLPFVWQKINTELGSESLQSTIPFDRQVLTLGNVGVHACNGSNVQRIDEKIPDIIFSARTANQGLYRMAGVRDFFNELSYWAFPTTRIASSIFPDNILVYNYQNGAWASFDDCITSFGYLEQEAALSWTTPLNWNDTSFFWGDGTTQANVRLTLAGNQQGYLFIMDSGVNRNAPVMQVSNIVITSINVITLTILNHTLNPGYDYILLENLLGSAFLVLLENSIFLVETAPTANTITITNPGVPAAGFSYNGGGSATRVSNLQLVSKQWNPYIQQDTNLFLQRIDFQVMTTTGGQITVDYFPSYSTLSMVTEGTGEGSILGTNVLETSPYALYPLEQEQDFVWHPVYFQSVGESIQIRMYMTDDQMTDNANILGPFELDAMTLFTQRSGRTQ